jgi:hypothetical protein
MPLEDSAISHLVMLHQVVAALQEELYPLNGPVRGSKRSVNICASAVSYLIAHRRDDSDFADLGRRLKTQYSPTAKQ